MKQRTVFLLAFLTLCQLVFLSGAERIHLQSAGSKPGNSEADTWIDVLSVKWMAPESISQKQYKGSQQRAAVGGIKLTKRIDGSSPLLQEACNNGTSIGDISLMRGKETVILSDIRVLSIVKHGRTEIISLSCQSVSTESTAKLAVANNNKTRSNRTKAAPANHNTTRANRVQPAQNSAPAQDYNSSRSNTDG
jgi:type VI protein secretion system component Hcp